MNKPECAAEYMKQEFNCAQAIVKAFANDVSGNEADLVRLAAPLGGGIGRNGHVCGALLGAMLILGKKYGNLVPSEVEAREKAYAYADRLMERFEAEHHSIMCRDLIAVDLKNPTELVRAREQGVFQRLCPAFVLTAGKILDELLASKA